MYKPIWDLELKTNSNLFKTVILTKHITRKEAIIKELFFQKNVQAPKNPLYINKALAQVNGSHGYAMGRTDIKELSKKFWDSSDSLPLRKFRSERMFAENNPMYNLPKDQTPCYGRTGDKHPMFGKRGKDSPFYGRKSSESTRELISKNHADVSGANNPKALSWKLTSPTGIEYLCIGDIETLVSEHN